MPPRPLLSFQLYSARNFPPLDEQIAMLASLGYENVEPFGALLDQADALGTLLRRHGLTAKSSHVALEALETGLPAAASTLRSLGTELAVAPYLVAEQRPGDAAGWASLGERLAAVAGKLKAEGLRFAWHNHDFEFRPLADGSMPIEHLIVGDVLWEADLAWVAKADVDPLPWLDRYSGRVPALHVKDIAPAGEKADEDGWADVGTGVLPWPALWRAAMAAGAEMAIAEHDNPSDARRFAAASLDAMRAMAGS